MKTKTLPAELQPEDVACVVEYREIPGFPGYRAGTDGSIWSAFENHGSKQRTIGSTWKQLQAVISGTHYAAVGLCRNGKAESRMVHRVVLSTFVVQPEGKTDACHRDGDKYNNALSNLYWGTRSENMAEMVRHGRSCIGEVSVR